MTEGLSFGELAEETGAPPERLEWLVAIGTLHPLEDGSFRAAEVFRVKMVSALLEAGFTREQIGWAASEGT